MARALQAGSSDGEERKDTRLPENAPGAFFFAAGTSKKRSGMVIRERAERRALSSLEPLIWWETEHFPFRYPQHWKLTLFFSGESFRVVTARLRPQAEHLTRPESQCFPVPGRRPSFGSLRSPAAASKRPRLMRGGKSPRRIMGEPEETFHLTSPAYMGFFKMYRTARASKSPPEEVFAPASLSARAISSGLFL